MRFYEINDGKITFNGIDIRDMKRGELSKYFWNGSSRYLVV